VRLVYGDVTDRESLKAAVAGQEIVYHVAGCVLALQYRRFYQVNRDGMANMAPDVRRANDAAGAGADFVVGGGGTGRGRQVEDRGRSPVAGVALRP